MSLEKEASLLSAPIWSSARLRSRRTACAASWLLQKSGWATRASRDFKRSRCCGASKKTPNERDAGFQSFVSILQVFENHFLGPPEKRSNSTPWRDGRHLRRCQYFLA